MKVKIYGEWEESKKLNSKIKTILEELWLNDFIWLELTNDVSLQEELKIKKTPALIIEEEAIDFKDVIFEGMIPEDEEIKAMFTSIIWGWEGVDWCSSWSCWSCSSGC